MSTNLVFKELAALSLSPKDFAAWVFISSMIIIPSIIVFANAACPTCPILAVVTTSLKLPFNIPDKVPDLSNLSTIPPKESPNIL